MTNKRKIAILSLAVMGMENIITFEQLPVTGICMIIYEILSSKEIEEARKWCKENNSEEYADYYRSEFKIDIPVKKALFKWGHKLEDFEERIRVCKKAIERLSE